MMADKTEAKKSTTDKALTAATKAAKPGVKPASQKTGAKPKPAAKKTEKAPKVKVVHDSFSMPKTEHQKIAEIKEACLKAGLRVKKSEVLRAGLKALGEMNGAQLKGAMAGLGKVKASQSKKL
jgi:hypothetical protein